MRRTIDCASEAQSHKDEWNEDMEHNDALYVDARTPEERERDAKITATVTYASLDVPHKDEYSRCDHIHCFDQEKSPCGIQGKHRCCLCEMEPYKDEWEETIEHTAMNIVYQLDDDSGASVEFRQANNDKRIDFVARLITSLLASQKKELVEKLEIAKEPLPAITMSAKEAVSFNRGIDTAIALIQE